MQSKPLLKRSQSGTRTFDPELRNTPQVGLTGHGALAADLGLATTDQSEGIRFWKRRQALSEAAQTGTRSSPGDPLAGAAWEGVFSGQSWGAGQGFGCVRISWDGSFALPFQQRPSQ